MFDKFVHFPVNIDLPTFWVDEFNSHPDFKGYNLRVTEPELCDPSVKQLSGYLDIANDKHLFFW
jgi:hypothetical protein